jgi:hypothetical protein
MSLRRSIEIRAALSKLKRFLIGPSVFEQVAQLLGLNVPDGNRDAAVAAVDRTFFGKVDAVRWTGSAVEDGPDPQRLLVRGEATHRNKIWQPFEVDMIRDAGSWKMLRIRPLPLPWM